MKHRIDEINKILLDLYEKGRNGSFDSEDIYKYFTNYGVSKDIRNVRIGSWDDTIPYLENVFSRLEKYYLEKGIKNYAISSGSSRFCWFLGGSPKKRNDLIDNNYLKMYIPLCQSHIFLGSKMIFDFLYRNDIAHQSKVASRVRSDDIVVRLTSVEDCKKLQQFVDNNKYIQEGLQKVNPFAFNKNGVAYAVDGELSYTDVLSKFLFEFMKEYKNDKSRFTYKGFYHYLLQFYRDRNRLEKFIEFKDRDKVDNYYQVLTLLLASLSSNDMKVYYQHFNSCNGLESDFNRVMNRGKEDLIHVGEKEELLRELILVSTLKYSGSSKESDGRFSGFDLLCGYVKTGKANFIVRDRNLRERVCSYLSSQDIVDILLKEGFYSDNLDKNMMRYCHMVVFNYVMDRMKEVYPDDFMVRMEAYLRVGKDGYITREKQARRFAGVLDRNLVHEVFSVYGCENILDYYNKIYLRNRKGK